MRYLTLIICLYALPSYSFFPNIGFWQHGLIPKAYIENLDLGPNPSNDFSMRSVQIGGFGVFNYKAIVITSGTCTDASAMGSLNAVSAQSVGVPFQFTPSGSSTYETYTICAIGQNYVGLWQSLATPTVSDLLEISSALPSATSINLDNGATTTGVNNIPVALSASDPYLNVSHFCLKKTVSSTVPPAPLSDDSCWVAVDAPNPGVTRAQNISFSNYFTLLGFASGDYTVYAWVKNEAGSISALSNSGNGTSDIDKDIITFNQGQPPSVINVLATSTNTPADPPSSSDLTTTTGSDVFIKWHVSDDEAIPAGAISLAYTTDEVNFTTIVTGLNNGVTGACSVDGVEHTGCYHWVGGAPTNTYYRVQVTITDSDSLTSKSSSTALNTSAFRFLAGNTDPGTGSSATSAMIFTHVDGMNTDTKAIVVTPEGEFYIRDYRRGLMHVNPTDGKLNQVIPITGTSTDGMLGTATLASNRAKITLDYEGNIIIYDGSYIRKFDISTSTVSTIIGGGVSTGSGIAANQLSMSCNGWAAACPFQVLPNNDIYFFRRGSGAGTDGTSLYHYNSSDGLVYSIAPNGTGVSGNAGMILDSANSTFTHFGVQFDTATSNIEKFFSNHRRKPCTGCGNAMNSALLNHATDWSSTGAGYDHTGIGASPHSFVTSMDGQLYSIPEYATRSLWRLTRGTNSWTKILGTGTIGNCPDGTPALSCNVYLQDAFITAEGQVYFLDNGLVRTIDGSGNVVTLFGQSRTFGDGGLALSARFNTLRSMDQLSNGDILVLDYTEHLMRKITPGGNINKFAGTGVTGYATPGQAAVSEPMPGGYWGTKYRFIVDSDHVYFTPGTTRVSRINASTGLVEHLLGGGATSYDGGDGTVGVDIAGGGYPAQILGVGGGQVLVAWNRWNGTAQQQSYWKMYDINDSYRQAQLAGHSGLAGGTYLADGDLVASANVRMGFGDANLRGYWDNPTNTWYFSWAGGSVIKALPIGGNVSTAFSLPRGQNAWTMVKNTSSEWVIYYCGTDGRMYKYNGTTSTETALTWPNSSISCLAGTVMRNSTRNSIVFLYAQNGLQGVAEIIDTP